MKLIKHPIYGMIPKPKKNMFMRGGKRIKPMTEWQKKKIGWYRNNKKWDEHIQGRVQLPNGDIAVKDSKGNIKEVLPKEGKFYA